MVKAPVCTASKSDELTTDDLDKGNITSRDTLNDLFRYCNFVSFDCECGYIQTEGEPESAFKKSDWDRGQPSHEF